MAHDAVTHRAKAGKIYEQPFLEQCRQWTVEIGRLREAPEFIDQARSGCRRAKEIRHQAEASLNLLGKPALVRRSVLDVLLVLRLSSKGSPVAHESGSAASTMLCSISGGDALTWARIRMRPKAWRVRRTRAGLP